MLFTTFWQWLTDRLNGYVSVHVADAAAAIELAVPARTWKAIVLHHSATSGGSVASIDAVNRRQKDRGGVPWRGIGYHFVVGNGQQMGDGQIQPTFRWREQLDGAHAAVKRMNEQAIGICLIGNFDDVPPTPIQVVSRPDSVFG